MTPTLWPGFSPSRLQPANFLASKAIWYPAARQRCGSDREAGVGPRALGNRKDILCPLLAHSIPLPPHRQPVPPQKACGAGAKPAARLVDKTQGAGFSPCGPGQPHTGRLNQSGSQCRGQGPCTPSPVLLSGPQVFPNLYITQDTRAQRKTHVHK